MSHRRIISLIKDVKGTLLLCLAVFVLGFLTGIIVYPLVEEHLLRVVELVYGNIIVEGSKFRTAQNIILRNLNATLMGIFLGITIVFTLLILFVNGFIDGLVLRFALEKDISKVKILYGVLPHAIPEMAAFFLSAAFGIRIGFALMFSKERRKNVVKTFKDATLVYLVVIVPLIVLAGIVESYVSASLLR